MMLEGLNMIKWNKLWNSAGRTAEKVPIYLRTLMSTDPTERSQGLRGLRPEINGGYILASASVYTVPFLVELLNSGNIRGKERILGLLVEMTRPVETENYPELGDIYGDVWREPEKRATLVLLVNKAISKGLPVYLSLLTHLDWQVRKNVVTLLTGHPIFVKSDAQQIAHEIFELILRESNSEVKEVAIIGLDDMVSYSYREELAQIANKYLSLVQDWKTKGGLS
jgi:hypothetical protein